jgi:hypothetical protein
MKGSQWRSQVAGDCTIICPLPFHPYPHVSQLLVVDTNHTRVKMTTSQLHPVAIIGGGPVGLSSSIFLSLRNILYVLFERHHGTSIHPKACGLNQRTGEIFRQMGVE